MSIFVTGIGAVSALGLDSVSSFEALKIGQTGIKYSATHEFMCGEVQISNGSIIQNLELPDKEYSRTTLLGLVAAKEAWYGNEALKDVRTGLVSATSVGGLDRIEKYYFASKEDGGSNYSGRMLFENGRTTEHISEYLGINGHVGTISTACSSGANAVMQGAKLIQANRLDRVLVGGTDPISLYNLKGFSSLKIYDSEVCKTFDEHRNGLNMGEGAGYLLLENETSMAKSGNTPICELVGWNNSSDAYHQTASSAEGKGAILAMEGALNKANIKAEDIDYINAHGTGTKNNDLSESMALAHVFKHKVPPFSSTKGFTGHTLAAAGAIEAVFCVQAIKERAWLPTYNFENAMKETGLIPVQKFTTNQKLNYVLSNSFGFGGNCSSLIFKAAGHVY